MKVDRNKPLVQMDKNEFQAAFDQIGMDLHGMMLKDARNGSLPLRLAITYLKPAGEVAEVVMSFSAEYGDEEGTNCEKGLIESIKRTGLLLPGESLRLEVVDVERVK